jgi:hypothetical protein
VDLIAIARFVITTSWYDEKPPFGSPRRPG